MSKRERDGEPEGQASGAKWLRSLERRVSTAHRATVEDSEPTPVSSPAQHVDVQHANEEEDGQPAAVLPDSFRRIADGQYPCDWSFAKRLRFLSLAPLRVHGLLARDAAATGSLWLSLDDRFGFYVSPASCRASDWALAFRSVVAAALHDPHAASYFYCLRPGDVLLARCEQAPLLLYGPAKKSLRQRLLDQRIDFKLRLPDGALTEPQPLDAAERLMPKAVADDLRALRDVPGQSVSLESHKPPDDASSAAPSTTSVQHKLVAVSGAEHVERFLRLFLDDVLAASDVPPPQIVSPRPFLNGMLRGVTYEQRTVLRPGDKKTQPTQLLSVEAQAPALLLPSIVRAVVGLVAELNRDELIEGHVVYSASQKKDVSSLLRQQPLQRFALNAGELWG